MSSSLVIAGATFPKPLISLTLPDRSNLVGEYIFGGSQAATIVNRANAVLPLTPTGAAVTYNPNSVIVAAGTGGGGYDSGITPSGDSTWVLIRKPANTPGSGLMATANVNNQGFASFGTNSYFRNTLTSQVTGGVRVTPGASVINFNVGRYNFAGFCDLFYYSAGVQQQSTSGVVGLNTISPANIVFGGTTIQPGTVSTHEIYYAAIFNRSLTAAQIDAVWQSLLVYYAALGITIT